MNKKHTDHAKAKHCWNKMFGSSKEKTKLNIKHTHQAQKNNYEHIHIKPTQTLETHKIMHLDQQTNKHLFWVFEIRQVSVTHLNVLEDFSIDTSLQEFRPCRCLNVVGLWSVLSFIFEYHLQVFYLCVYVVSFWLTALVALYNKIPCK